MKTVLPPVVAGLALLAAGCGASATKHVQQLSNENDLRSPAFVARVTGAVLHGPNRPGTLVTVTFTVEEQGRPPGTGVPRGSGFLLLLTRANQLTPAHGQRGYYSATGRLGPGGLAGIQIGGFMPSSGPRVENGGFWLPTVVDVAE